MPPIRAQTFRGRIGMVTLSFITCHNLSNEVSSLFRVFQQEKPGKQPFSPSSDSLTSAWTPTVHKLCHKLFVDYVMYCFFLVDSSTAISLVVIRRFCLMVSSTAEIVVLLINNVRLFQGVTNL
ncbi:hypothetical protein CEXT_45901 [Caerostris extrusa]|uniref:Uncharacterized protein n=1 Tax=Caerostris extrusa TaxID=172846 RepID=A0AAV4M943_CAEEX|nr:hypothetical protein CEXT_45901 [Caerostris extrusa]